MVDKILSAKASPELLRSPAGAWPAVAGRVQGPISTPIEGRKIPYAIASGNLDSTDCYRR